MKVLIGVVLLASFVYTDALRCRRCISATTIDDCTKTVPCDASTEECYMAEIVTAQKSIEYNAGCRAKEVCKASGAHIIGKRQLTCFECCNHDDCNRALCNIKSSFLPYNQCYKCSGVSDMQHCTTLTACQPDEMCNARTYSLGGRQSYESGCASSRFCSLLTLETLKRMKECRAPNANPNICGNHKRETSGAVVCNACCGDSLCNGDTCEQVLDHLYNLWTANALDLHSLQSVSALITTTAKTTT